MSNGLVSSQVSVGGKGVLMTPNTLKEFRHIHACMNTYIHRDREKKEREIGKLNF